MSASIGAKAANLLRLRDEFSLTVPAFAIIPFERFISDYKPLQRTLQKDITGYITGQVPEATAFKRIAKRVESLQVTPTVLSEINQEILEQGWKKVSFRTSASSEDGAEHSFAGQYESYVDSTYTKQALKKYLIACFTSTLSPRVLRYAKAQGLHAFHLGGSVVIQEMFYGEKSGVLFSENGNATLTIEYVDSWKNTVVEGESAHSIHLAKYTKTSRNTPAFAKELHGITTQLEATLGYPVDIEWAYDGTRLAFLQLRPQTTAFREYVLDWDSTNIAENYPGVTLPLTYSFIRTLYARVYPSFFNLLGTRQKILKQYEPVFTNMLGYLDGHIYYRISNWYEVVRLIPGKRNQLYFEAMLNPVERKAAASKASFDIISLVAIARFGWLLLRSEAYSRKFKRLIAKKLHQYQSMQWAYLTNATILRAIQDIRTDLLTAWATPILNDIRVMVFHGILKTAFFGKDHQESYLQFLQGLTDRASIKPLLALQALGAETSKALAKEKVPTISALKTTASWPAIEKAAGSYITDYAARTPDELKLENTRLTDETSQILTLALNASSAPITFADTSDAVPRPSHISTWKYPLLRFVAHNTRRAIDWRERFRFNRAQVFNVARDAFTAIGVTLHEEGALASARDIFWLTEQEIDEIINGHAWNYNPRALIASRKKEFAAYEKSTIARGVQGAGALPAIHLHATEKDAATDGVLKGSGVAPGVLTAEVIIATTFDPLLDVRGKILVTTHIDPGWTLLFTQAAGIITERGNALSHAAIIAREIGIPAIVAVPNATQLLKTGNTVTINGITGSISEKK